MNLTGTINTPLLRKVLEHITLNPDEWEQRVWFDVSATSPCGTAGCLAGWTAVFSGVPLRYRTVGAVVVPSWGADGRTLETVAQEELGLPWDLAEDLFEARNTLADLWGMAEFYTGGDIRASEMDSLLATQGAGGG